MDYYNVIFQRVRRNENEQTMKILIHIVPLSSKRWGYILKKNSFGCVQGHSDSMSGQHFKICLNKRGIREGGRGFTKIDHFTRSITFKRGGFHTLFHSPCCSGFKDRLKSTKQMREIYSRFHHLKKNVLGEPPTS